MEVPVPRPPEQHENLKRKTADGVLRSPSGGNILPPLGDVTMPMVLLLGRLWDGNLHGNILPPNGVGRCRVGEGAPFTNSQSIYGLPRTEMVDS